MSILRTAGALLLLALLAGCGGSSLTGGGVPAGRAALEGTVISADDPGEPVVGAEVSLEVDPATRSAYTTRTDAAGAFSFADVPEGDATVRVALPAGVAGRPYAARVRMRAGETMSLAVAIEPDDAGLGVISLTVAPESIDTWVGVPVDLTATARLANGRPIRPTWLVEGGIGHISHGGRFMPLRAGTGQIRVRAGDQERVVPVVVRARGT